MKKWGVEVSREQKGEEEYNWAKEFQDVAPNIIWYDKIRYIYVRSKADEIASLPSARHKTKR